MKIIEKIKSAINKKEKQTTKDFINQLTPEQLEQKDLTTESTKVELGEGKSLSDIDMVRIELEKLIFQIEKTKFRKQEEVIEALKPLLNKIK